MPDGKRLWRTSKGTLVEDGHPDGRFLAYGVSDALSDEDAAVLKAAAAPANKQARAPKNKGA